MKDFDFELQYHPRKANVVADALSWKQMLMSALMVKEFELIEKSRDINLGLQLRVCIPTKNELKKMILEEGHKSRLSIHPGMIKMYNDLKESFWWSLMKKDVAKFVSSCLVCQKAKIEHQRPGGMLP
ncbi:uncharacterized protein LOC124841610 [Vigna umbellata]|uniref:uncharacterized protein LOC124841610 n=1 Tax=Vigna umbellata TaxID=87088 RepID=UPI001F5F919C|nr:uncharacterized protein LOC124841610 [Vigna umbellata]